MRLIKALWLVTLQKWLEKNGHKKEMKIKMNKINSLRLEN